MLFRRRQPLTFKERVRLALWPSNGWRRAWRYFTKRVLRISATPYVVAAGFACGVFVTFTPFIGLHFLMSMAMAFVIRGNIVAAALACLLGNPVTYPFIFAATYHVGNQMLGVEEPTASADISRNLAEKSFDALWPIIKPLAIGGIPLGLAAALFSYAIVYFAVRSFQNLRRERLASRRIARGAAMPKPMEPA